MGDKQKSIWDVEPNITIGEAAAQMRAREISEEIAGPPREIGRITPDSKLRAPKWGERHPLISETIQELPRMGLTAAGVALGAPAGPPGMVAGYLAGSALGSGAKYGMKAAAPDLFGPKEAYDANQAVMDVGIDAALAGAIPGAKIVGRGLRDNIIRRYSEQDPHIKEAFKWFFNENPTFTAPMTSVLGDENFLSNVLRNTSFTSSDPLKRGYAKTRGQIQRWLDEDLLKTSGRLDYFNTPTTGDKFTPKQVTSGRIQTALRAAYDSAKGKVQKLYQIPEAKINAVVDPETKIAGPIQFTKWDEGLTRVLQSHRTDSDVRAIVKDLRLDRVNNFIDDVKQMYSRYYPSLSEGPLAAKFNNSIITIEKLIKGGVVAYDDLKLARADLNNMVYQIDKQNLPSGIAQQFKGSLKTMAGLMEEASNHTLATDPRYGPDIIAELMHAKENYTKFLDEFPRNQENFNKLLTKKVPGQPSSQINYDKELDALFNNEEATAKLLQALKDNPDVKTGYKERLISRSRIVNPNVEGGMVWNGTALLRNIQNTESVAANRLLSSDERAAYTRLATVMNRTDNGNITSKVGSQAAVLHGLRAALTLLPAGAAYLLSPGEGLKIPAAAVSAGLMIAGLRMAPNQLAKFATSPRNARLLANAMEAPQSDPANKSRMRQMIKGMAGMGLRITAQLANGNEMEVYVNDKGELVPIPKQ